MGYLFFEGRVPGKNCSEDWADAEYFTVTLV